MRALLAAAGAGALASLALAATGAGLELELVTLRGRLALSSVVAPQPVDARIVVIDGGASLDPERLADLVEIARAHGARAQGLLTVPEAPSERLRAAVEECRCVVVPESHVLVSVAAARAHVGVDVSAALARVPFAAGTRATFALALARIGGAPANVDGREQAFVRPRSARVLSVDDVIAPQIDLDATFRGALVLVGPPAALAVHASVLDDLMNARLLELPPVTVALPAVAALALAGAWAGGRRRPWLRLGALVVVPLGTCGLTSAATTFIDVWLPLAVPLFAFGVAFLSALVFSWRARASAI